MIPFKGKTYRIDFWFQINNPEDESSFYKGLGTFTGETDVSEDGEILYQFETPDNALLSFFAEEDIMEEVK
jgi:hypothetical protein